MEWRASGRRLGATLLAAAALATLVTVPAAARDRDAARRAEAAYRQALADLASGSLTLASAGVVAAEKDTSEDCLQAVEVLTAQWFAASRPEAIVVQAFLRVAVQQSRYPVRAGSGLLVPFELTSIATLRRLGKLYREASTNPEAATVLAGLLTYMARDISSPRSAQRLETSRALLEDALQRDADHVAALHMLAVTLELSDLPGQALSLVERLLEIDPGNRRFLLRRAILTVKAGRRDRGRELLAELAAGDPDWVADLAAQELARLVLAAGEEDEAVAVLRRALEARPDQKLALQLAATLDPRWGESWRVLRTLSAAPPGDPGPSPRWLYDLGAEGEITVLRGELNRAISARLEDTARALRGLPPLADLDSRIVADCR